jgi:ergothioneine biosynthesis protein EgtB
LIQSAVAIANRTATAQKRSPAESAPAENLLARFHEVRDFTAGLSDNLVPEDCVVQSMPEVSPTKWHLAHTTWFFETFILKKWVPGYRDAVPEYAYLFNSYYNAAGAMHRRDLRGLISRPTVKETKGYRRSIDRDIDDLISSADEKLFGEIEPILTLGIHHEQQHQELLITDIKHVFAQNPLYPVFREDRARPPGAAKPSTDGSAIRPYQFVEFDESIIEIGHDGNGFSYDNEGPRHRALVLPFSLADRLITNGEYLAFMADNGYSRAEFWLSLGWTTVNEQNWRAPLYWIERDGQWWNFTLSGLRPVDPNEPVTHLSYFEADAYANWAGARLPTELNGSARPPRSTSMAISLRTSGSIPPRQTHRRRIGSSHKCLATFGSGPAVPTRLIPAIGPGRAPSANTTASSCAINTFSGAALARPHAPTFAKRTATSFRPINGGNSPGSVWRAISRE